MSAITLYHNPRCSKSRQALALLEEIGKDFDVVRYLDVPPSVETLRAWLPLLGDQAAELVRPKEAAEAGIDHLAGDDLLSALANHPKALQRPIVCVPGRVIIARPPEKLLELFS